jgi:hypothetical protein
VINGSPYTKKKYSLFVIQHKWDSASLFLKHELLIFNIIYYTKFHIHECIDLEVDFTSHLTSYTQILPFINID